MARVPIVRLAAAGPVRLDRAIARRMRRVMRAAVIPAAVTRVIPGKIINIALRLPPILRRRRGMSKNQEFSTRHTAVWQSLQGLIRGVG